MNKLMQFAHEAGLIVSNSRIIPTKDGRLCAPDKALLEFARRIIEDDAAAMVELIEEHEAALWKDHTGLLAVGGISALAVLKKRFK